MCLVRASGSDYLIRGLMTHIFRKLAIAFGLLIFCGVVAWHALPSQVAKGLIALNNASAGLRSKVISTDVGDIHYLEGGQGETVLLVHGIYARKEHWVEVARVLAKDYRVIAVDLPGFGDNALRADDDYLLDQQQANLLTVMQALELKFVHVGANSMGAYVAALLAEEHPDLIASLSFIGSPLGVPTPTPSDMDKARDLGITPLVVQTTEDFAERNEWLSPNIPYIPGPILRTWSEDEVARADHNARIWDVVHRKSGLPTVLDLAPSLEMPTLIIWCQEDRIFHISGAALLDQNLPSSHLATLDNCGHVPMLDKPNAVASEYLKFLSSLPDPK